VDTIVNTSASSGMLSRCTPQRHSDATRYPWYAVLAAR